MTAVLLAALAMADADADRKAFDLVDRACKAFRAGQVAESLPLFEKAIELSPRMRPQLWQYGIALYYAGRPADGAKLFADHKTVNPEDVENAFWHFLCTAKAESVEKARAGVITVRRDGRPVMAQVQALLEGKATADDVLAAAEAETVPAAERTRARFYAHLYVGLYLEATGDAKKAGDHIAQAVKLKVPDYMWDVAKVDLDRRK